MNKKLKNFKVNLSDPSVIAVIDKVARDTKVTAFSYQSIEDIRQEIWVISLNALKEWQPDKITSDTSSMAQAIEKFLRVTIHNRLVNKFKEVTKTVRSPCPRCEYFDETGKTPGSCFRFKDEREKCKKFVKFTNSVSSRNDLLNIMEDSEEQNNENEWDSEINARNINQQIQERLDEDLLGDFKNMLNGIKISKTSINKIREITSEILKEKTNAE